MIGSVDSDDPDSLSASYSESEFKEGEFATGTGAGSSEDFMTISEDSRTISELSTTILSTMIWSLAWLRGALRWFLFRPCKLWSMVRMCITALSESLNAQTIGGIWLLSHSANCECKVFCLGTLPTPASARSFKVEKQRSNIPHSELWPFLAILDNFHKSFGLHCESGTLSLKMRSATLFSKSTPFVRDIEPEILKWFKCFTESSGSTSQVVQVFQGRLKCPKTQGSTHDKKEHMYEIKIETCAKYIVHCSFHVLFSFRP
jgi:hypothetical protein